MTIVIRADANGEIGTGHLSRCLALAEAIADDELILAYHEAPTSLLKRFQSLGAILHPIKSKPFGKADASECNTLKGDWIIVDGYQFEESFFTTLKPRTVALDDFARPPVMTADIIVNPGASAKPDWYDRKQTTLLGPRYVPMRKEFRGDSSSRQVGKILVTTGGGDDLNITPQIIRELGKLASLTVVIGPANPHRDDLVGDYENQATFLEGVENMAAEIASSSLVICGAGSTVWECLALGTPLLPMILAENQVPNHDYLISNHFASTGGDARTPEFLPTLRAGFLNFINDPESALQAAERGQQLVDGRGAIRIFEQMRHFCHSPHS